MLLVSRRGQTAMTGDMAAVVYRRYCVVDPQTYREIGQALAMSQQAARRLAARALDRLGDVEIQLHAAGLTEGSRLWTAMKR